MSRLEHEYRNEMPLIYSTPTRSNLFLLIHTLLANARYEIPCIIHAQHTFMYVCLYDTVPRIQWLPNVWAFRDPNAVLHSCRYGCNGFWVLPTDALLQVSPFTQPTTSSHFVAEVIKSSLSLFRLLWRRCMMLRKAAPSCRRKLLKPCASEMLSYHSFCLSLALEEYDYCCGRCCCSLPAAAESAVMVWPYCHPS